MLSHALSTKTLVTMVLVALVCIPMAVGKKPPKDPPPPDAPIEYQLTFIDPLVAGSTTKVKDTNNQGVVVGYSVVVPGTDYSSDDWRAIMWAAASGTVDMNTLTDVWFDLETGNFVDGWIAIYAAGINESLQVVGTARKEGFSRSFFYESGQGFYLLPYPETLPAPRNVARRINEQGVVIGEFTADPDSNNYEYPYIWDPNNPGVVHIVDDFQPDPGFVYADSLDINDNYFVIRKQDEGSTGFRVYSFGFDAGNLVYSLVISLTEGTAFDCLNNENEIALNHTISRRKKAIYRDSVVDGSRTVVAEKSTRSTLHAYNLNDAGDVYYSDAATSKLYRETDGTSVEIYSLLDDAAKAEWDAANPVYIISDWFITDDNIAGVPVDDPYDTMVGVFYTPDNYPAKYRAFILTPVELP